MLIDKNKIVYIEETLLFKDVNDIHKSFIGHPDHHKPFCKYRTWDAKSSKKQNVKIKRDIKVNNLVINASQRYIESFVQRAKIELEHIVH